MEFKDFHTMLSQAHSTLFWISAHLTAEEKINLRLITLGSRLFFFHHSLDVPMNGSQLQSLNDMISYA